MIGVTGATGFIGNHLMDSLGESGIAIDLRNDSNSEICEQLKKNNVGIVVHLANPIPSANQDEQKNIEREGKILAKRMVDIADSVGDIYFIVLSSIRVYPNGFDVFNKDTPLGPIDGYGRGKVAAERYFKESKHRVLGLRASSVLGVDLNGYPRGVLGTFVNQTKDGNKLKVMGDGSAKKDLLHVTDLIKLIMILIEHEPPSRDLFLPVGGGKSCTVLELANLVSIKTECEIIFIEPALFELSNSVDIDDICKLSGWTPSWTIEKMVQESVDTMWGQ